MLGIWSVDALLAIAPADAPRLQEVAFDRSVFLFAAGLTLTTGLLVGLIGAAVVPSDIAQPLKDGVRGGHRRAAAA